MVDIQKRKELIRKEKREEDLRKNYAVFIARMIEKYKSQLIIKK